MQQIRRLPVLRDIEEGEISLAGEELDDFGTMVFTSFNLLLTENYKYEEATNDAIEPSILKVKYYKMRFPSMAEPLYRELALKHKADFVGNSEFTQVFDTKFASCVIRREGKQQTLIALEGEEIFMVEYEGKEDLSEKIDMLEKIIMETKGAGAGSLNFLIKS